MECKTSRPLPVGTTNKSETVIIPETSSNHCSAVPQVSGLRCAYMETHGSMSGSTIYLLTRTQIATFLVAFPSFN